MVLNYPINERDCNNNEEDNFITVHLGNKFITFGAENVLPRTFKYERVLRTKEPQTNIRSTPR